MTGLGIFISSVAALAICCAVWGVRKVIARAELKKRQWRSIYERLASTTNYLAKILAELERISTLMETNDASKNGD